MRALSHVSARKLTALAGCAIVAAGIPQALFGGTPPVVLQDVVTQDHDDRVPLGTASHEARTETGVVGMTERLFLAGSKTAFLVFGASWTIIEYIRQGVIVDDPTPF